MVGSGRDGRHVKKMGNQALAKHYGFTDEEPDSIINCEIKYLMGLSDFVRQGDAGKKLSFRT